MQMDFETGSLVQQEMGPDERLLWAGRPNPSRSLGQTIPVVLFGIPWTAFALFWVAAASGFGRIPSSPGGPWSFFPLFGVPFILVGLGMLTSPYWAYRKARRTVYAVTSQRLLILQCGRSRTVQSFAGDDVGDIQRTERADGCGDVVFARQAGQYSDWRSDRRPSVTPIGFFGIQDVRTVDALIRDTFKRGA